jgi:hypothetical protein
MSKAKDLSCWKIMNCQDSAGCVARQNSDHACWELARDFSHIQSLLGVCRDCLVYQIKRDSPVFSDDELTAILANRSLAGFNHPKCASIVFDRCRIVDERRRVRRFKVTGTPFTLSPHHDLYSTPFRLIDISKNGLAFMAPDIALKKHDLSMNIEAHGFHLKRLSGIIIPHDEVSADGKMLRRCGFRFTDLSGSQSAILDDLLLEYGQAC